MDLGCLVFAQSPCVSTKPAVKDCQNLIRKPFALIGFLCEDSINCVGEVEPSGYLIRFLRQKSRRQLSGRARASSLADPRLALDAFFPLMPQAFYKFSPWLRSEPKSFPLRLAR